MKKILVKLLIVILAVSCVLGVSINLAGCGKNDKIKIGVLVADNTGAEAIAFKNYYNDYIKQQYNVTFMYSDITDSSEKELAAIDNFIANNCKAVISFSSEDRPAQIQKCEDNKIYYSIATGALSEDDYEGTQKDENQQLLPENQRVAYKNYKYFVGSIGPMENSDFAAGYAMAKHYIKEGKTKFGIYGGALRYYDSMHLQRAAGMISALCEDEGTTYNGKSNPGEIIGSIYSSASQATGFLLTIDTTQFTSSKFELVGYVDDFPPFSGDSTPFYNDFTTKIVSKNPDVVMCVGMGGTFFPASLNNTSIKIGDIDSFVPANGELMKNGVMTFLSGKFASSIGPIFIATLNAINGNAIRTADDCALRLDQGFWYATTYEEFQANQAADLSTSPAYNKSVLDKYLASEDKAVSYKDFAEFVSKYSLDEIKELN